MHPHRSPWLPALLALAAPVASQGEPDHWSPRVTLRTSYGWYAAPIHATLLPTGDVSIVGYARPTFDAPPAYTQRHYFVTRMPPLGAPTPPQIFTTHLPAPLDAIDRPLPPEWIVNDDLFCMGNTLTADGELFTVGGTRVYANFNTGEFKSEGLPYATRLDPTGTVWTRVPADMLGVATLGLPARWYPTATRLHDGRILATGGFDNVLPAPTPNLTVEVFDPQTDAWTVLSDTSETPPEIFQSNFTDVYVLPAEVDRAELILFGNASLPILFDPDAAAGSPKWTVRQEPRPAGASGFANLGATSALLPLRVTDGEWGYSNGSVAFVGGLDGTVPERSVDVYDPEVSAWTRHLDLGEPRHDSSAVLLPDGRVLVVAGSDGVGGDPDVTYARYLDPRSDFRLSTGQSNGVEVRGYHTVALLLPDGRVLVGGGRDEDTEGTGEKASFRLLSPGYMSQPRPAITAAPSELTLGQPFTMETEGARPAEVVLLALGSMTHSFDTCQRYVELRVTAIASEGAAHTVRALAPPDARVAPPGYYMLFALDAELTPSIAEIVRVR